MKLIHACILVSSFLTSVCDASGSTSPNQAAASASSAYSPSQDVARAALAAPAVSSPDVPAALLSHLQKGRHYAEFRAQALVNGWKPVASSMCKANVVGDNYASLCAAHTGLASCHLCEQMPELGTCSGDGYCEMQFRHADTSKVLQVTTYGDTNGWDRADSGLIVTGWSFAKTPDK